MSTEQPTMYAFMIGIDDYLSPWVPDLGGCVSDVEAMEQLLVDKFGLNPANVVKLLNEQATHQAIKETFRTHLIGTAKAWAENGKQDPPPSFYFHYSGHGSQAVDESGTKPDGMDETIIPYDSRTDNIFDIKDWELGEMLEKLTQYTDNVTVFMDCCHSGSGTRKVDPSLVPTRRCEPDRRPQPNQRPASKPASGDFGIGKRSLVADGQELEERYVLLAGCRDEEEANEYRVPEGDGFRQHGAATYFVIEELSRMSPDRPLTYRELHERVRHKVNSQFPTQMPQCEGDRDREVFGGLRPQRDILLTVVEKSDGYIWVDGGMAHGLTEGSQLHVYPADTRTLADAGEPIAMLSVEEVGAVRSACLVEEGEMDIAILAKAAIYRLNHGNMQRGVILDIADADLAAQIQAMLSEENVAPYVRLATEQGAAQFRIAQEDGLVEIQDAGGTRQVAPFGMDKLHELPQELTHIIRYHNALDLANDAVFAELTDMFQVQVKTLGFDEGTQQPIGVAVEEDNSGETVITAGERLVIEVTNQADIPLYFSILFFDYDWSISQLYPPAGAHERLDPGNTFQLGCSRKRREQLLSSLPKEVNEARQIVKVIATVDDADFELLQQGGLKSPFVGRRSVLNANSALSQLLEQTMTGGKKRALGPPPAAVEDEWTTSQVSYRLMR